MPETIIDPRFVDVDFEEEAKRLQIGTGDLSPSDMRMADYAKSQGLFAAYGDEFEIQSEPERTKRIEQMDEEGGLERLVRWILNQRNEGSCVGHAWTQAHMVKLAAQIGEANIVNLSATAAYKQIGSSPNSGANIDDALECGEVVGILPLDTPENRQRFGEFVMPPNGFRTPWPTGNWKPVAAQFRIVKRLIIRNVAEMEQAGINGHPVVVGRSGHSICYLRPSKRSGRGEIYANSWGPWGFGLAGHPAGFGFDSAGMVAASARYAWALVAVTTPDYYLAA